MPLEVIDLDAQATSPLAPKVLQAMLPWLERQHWNPHSAHRGGRMAKAAVEVARMQVAALAGCAPERLIFTSGATEANNLALKGTLEGRSGRLLTFPTEHSCVRNSATHLRRLGHEVEFLPVRADGMPDLAAYDAALARGDVALVSAMWVNNEIGSIWPIADMAARAHAAGALFHTDAAQAFGKIDVQGAGVDLMSLTAHKIHGPKGIGALVVGAGVKLTPQLDGGGQEAGVRSGTLAPALAAGFGAAAAAADLAATRAHAETLAGIALDILGGVRHRVNGPAPLSAARWPGNLSVTFPGVDASHIISALPGIALSTGSACSSASGQLSAVLAAIGLPGAEIRQTLRLGWNSMLPAERLRDALGQLVATVRRFQKAPA